jgi:hypothetical protein
MRAARRPKIIVRETGKEGIQAAVIEHYETFKLPNTDLRAIPQARAFGQYGLRRGTFDLLIIGGNVTLAFLELKADDGTLSEEQEKFRKLLISHSIPYAVTYGREQPIAVLEEWGIVRKQARAA